MLTEMKDSGLKSRDRAEMVRLGAVAKNDSSDSLIDDVEQPKRNSKIILFSMYGY